MTADYCTLHVNNIVVRCCQRSGIRGISGSIIKISGPKTRVEENCLQGHHQDYGLKARDQTATIQIVAPLCKEMISSNNKHVNNCDCGCHDVTCDWGGDGLFEIVDDHGERITTVYEHGSLVPMY